MIEAVYFSKDSGHLGGWHWTTFMTRDDDHLRMIDDDRCIWGGSRLSQFRAAWMHWIGCLFQNSDRCISRILSLEIEWLHGSGSTLGGQFNHALLFILSMTHALVRGLPAYADMRKY